MTVSEIQYGLVARNEVGEIVHFVGFESEPTIKDAEHFGEELRSDTDFGLGDAADNLTIEPASQATVSLYRVICKMNSGS
jgi:hypothetical protein